MKKNNNLFYLSFYKIILYFIFLKFETINLRIKKPNFIDELFCFPWYF